MAKVYHVNRCPITDLPDASDGISLEVNDEFEIEGNYWFYPHLENRLLIVSGDLYDNGKFWKDYRREIEYLIFNSIWPTGMIMMTTPKLKALISSSNIPKTPDQKLFEILSVIGNGTHHFGEWIQINFGGQEEYSLVRATACINSDELLALLHEGISQGLLEEKSSTKMWISVSLTMSGWEFYQSFFEAKNSNIAFVAMSFDEEMFEVYNGWIEPAIRESGFEALIVSEQQIESDVTINDAILAGIKKAKFTIADFTHHKSGVYFEAGYALGRGQKVIYTCREDGIKDAHFDTRNYQHLVWKDGAELKKKLMDKIEVFIKN